MFRAVTWAIVLGLSLGMAAEAHAKDKKSSTYGKTIIIYTGSVDAKSAERLTSLISKNIDKIVGLKLNVAKSSNADRRYYSSLSGDQLNITSGDPMNAPVEVIVNDGVGTTTAGAFYTVDGFYLIKSGGSHAGGAISLGAMPVSEATIRLDPHIHLVMKPF